MVPWAIAAHVGMPSYIALIRSVMALAALATATVAAPAPAFAGTYDVRSCTVDPTASTPVRPSENDDAWQFNTNDSSHLESLNECPATAGSTVDGLIAQPKFDSGGAALGRFAEWHFDAPTGTTLARVRLWRAAGKRTNDWRLYTRTADGQSLSGSDCVVDTDFTCDVAGTGDWTVSTSSVRVGFECVEAGACTTGHSLREVWTAIRSALVTVNDTTAPTASGATGSLFAGGYVRGTVSAGVSSASDSTGIRALEVRADGGRVVGRSADRACDYSRRAPCPALATPETFSFDSRMIGDGTHTVQVGVLDTGENFAAAGTKTVTVDNTAPGAPAPTTATTLTATAPAAGIAWSNPSGQVAPITAARVAVCGPVGCTAHTQAPSGAATVGLDQGHGRYSVSVSLEDAAGNHQATNRTTWVVDYPAPATARPASPAIPATPQPPRAALASPRLAVARPAVARDRRTITVRGTVSPGVTGAVTIKATTRIGGRTRTVTRRASIRNRRYSARLRLPSASWRTANLTVRFAGSISHRAATATRTVRQRSR
jgi:hypothetical protein